MDVLALINQNYLLNGAGLWEHRSCNGYISKKTEGINFCWMNRPWAALLVSVVYNIHTVLMKRFQSKCYVLAICFPLWNPLQVWFCLTWHSLKKNEYTDCLLELRIQAEVLEFCRSYSQSHLLKCRLCPNRTPSSLICVICPQMALNAPNEYIKNGRNRIEMYFRTQL